ncbi:MAG: DUF3617 domain-containing protein [Rubrivivax sp.]|nr:DUF3617 domain-containing protein [Rubrivivax sp.]
MKYLPLAATLLLACLSTPAWSQKLTPGLWEQSVTMKSQSGRMEQGMAQMQQQMAKLPPDQRKMMEQMMAGKGVGMAVGQPNTVRICITPEQAARDEMPQHDGRCKQTAMERSGNKVRFKFSCTGDPPTSGEGEYTFESSKAHSGNVVINTAVQGQPERMEMQTRGRWIAADCGAIKPLK